MDKASRKLETKPRFRPSPLVAARRRKGWTLRTLATRCGRPLATVARTLAGQSARCDTVADICDALGVHVDECWPMADLTAPMPVGITTPDGPDLETREHVA